MPGADWTGHLRVDRVDVPVRIGPFQDNEPEVGDTLIEIIGFAALTQIPLAHLDRRYLLEADAGTARAAYAALRQALLDSATAAQGFWRSGADALPVLVTASARGLELITLRQGQAVDTRPTTDTTQALARELIEHMRMPFDPRPRAAPATEPPAPSGLELSEALRESLRRTRPRKHPPAPSVRLRPRARKSHRS